MKTLLLHPRANIMGNILWPRVPTPEELALLTIGIERFRARGYWASFFPEGDGITFKWEGTEYNHVQALEDISESFAPVQVVEGDGPNGRVGLAELMDDDTQGSVRVRYLVPVDQFLLHESFTIGGTSFHAPVNGEEVSLEQHSWGMALCDVPGADVLLGWAPQKTDYLCGTTGLLAYPLIERQIDVPSKLFHANSDGVRGQEKFLSFIISDADRALDMLRWALCSYSRIEYLPNKAGWIGDFAHAYIKPLFGPRVGKLVSAKPDVLRVSNNWLGLEADALDIGAVAPIADVIDGIWQSEMATAVKASLRTFGQAYYMTEPESSFLSMLYATDALTGVRDLRGYRQRIWVAAAASMGKAGLFKEILLNFIDLYEIRNSLVHKAKTFIELERDPRLVNQDMSRILCLCIENMHEARYSTATENAIEIIERLSQPEFSEIASIHPWVTRDHVEFPIRNDKILMKMV